MSEYVYEIRLSIGYPSADVTDEIDLLDWYSAEELGKLSPQGLQGVANEVADEVLSGYIEISAERI